MGRWRGASLLLLLGSSVTAKPLLSKSPILCVKPHTRFRAFSALPSVQTNYFDSASIYSPRDDHHDQHLHPDSAQIPVKAFFLSTSINLKGMQAENLSNVVPATSRASNYIALRYHHTPSSQTNNGPPDVGDSCRYMMVFQYGSAVLFNIDDHEVENYLALVRKHALGLLPEIKKDDYAVKEKPEMVEDMEGGTDYIVLKSLDMDGVRIIGSVLGQSIALDYFVSQIDGMIEEFTHINRGMEKTGTFTMKKKKLLQLVGKANSNIAAVILKVGLFERSEIAWREAKYAQIHDYLREEYEVTQRFGNLDYKLKFVEHNIHFLQEVLQNRKSDFLEWCIIGLLIIENAISLYEILS